MDRALLRLAERQLGLLTLAQLDAAGADGLRRKRCADGEWREVQPGVCLPAGVPLTVALQRTAVGLSLRARRTRPGESWCFASTTAGALLGLRVPGEHRVAVLVSGSTRPRLVDGDVRTARELPTLRWVDGWPVVGVELAILQCGLDLTRDDLVTVVEHAVRDGRTTLPRLLRRCRVGVQGSAVLRDVVAELSREGHDRWVRVLVRLLRGAGLARPELERAVSGFLLDLCWWVLRLAIEVDDWQSHGSRDAQERDRRRDRRLWRDHGIVVLRVTPRELRDDPDRVVRDVVAAYRRAEQNLR